MKILLLGGDKKQLYLADYMQKKGYDVYVCGFEKYGPIKHKCVETTSIPAFKTVILPLPASKDNKTLFMPFSDNIITLSTIEQICKNSVVLGGNITLNVEKYTDYYKIDTLSILNAIPSAEGAIFTAIQNGEITIHGSNCLIIGNGKIGKALSARLKGLNANVTVSARKPSDLAYIKSNFCTAIPTENITDYIDRFDYIFNTVPAPILTAGILKKCNKEVVIIDLASMPGGTDFSAAKSLGIKTVHALSLPSKVSPKSAAIYIGQTITEYLESQKGDII